MTDPELEREYRKRYGKSPSFTELQQFRRFFGSGRSYITEEDRESIRKTREDVPKVRWNDGALSGKARKNRFQDEPDEDLSEEDTEAAPLG